MFTESTESVFDGNQIYQQDFYDICFYLFNYPPLSLGWLTKLQTFFFIYILVHMRDREKEKKERKYSQNISWNMHYNLIPR